MIYMAGQPIWQGRLSGGRRMDHGRPTDTLEPPRPARGLGLKPSLPGLTLVAAGAVLLLASAIL
jgi:hypothetical protein